MSFPASPIDLRAELLLNGTWTDVSSYGFNNGDFAGCTITRGKADESSQASPAQLTLGLNNADGRFTARNPSGAYYPNLVKNTQVRVSVPEQHSYLRLETDGFGYTSTPDSAGLSITGDMEIQIDVTLDNWNSPQVLCSKWTTGGNQRSWILMLNEDGTLQFAASADGSTIKTAPSLKPVPYPALGRLAIKVTLASSTGQLKYFTATDINGSWTQLGFARGLSAITVFDSTAAVRVGAPGTTAVTDYPSYTGIYGKVHAFKLLSGIGGTVKASPDFTTQAAGTTSFTDAQSNTWTVTGSTPHPEISDRNYRFHGEVASWPQTWDPTGNYVAVSVTANGLLRRLGQSSKPLKSAMYRYWTIGAATAPVAYWSLEDGDRANGFASGLSDGLPMTISDGIGNDPSFAANTDFLCSDALPTANQAIWKGSVPDYTAGTGYQVAALIEIPQAGESNGAGILLIRSSGDVKYAYLTYGTGSSGTLNLNVYGTDGFGVENASISSATPSYTGCNGQKLLVVISVANPVASVSTFTLSVAKVGATAFTTSSGTTDAVVSSLGKVASVTVDPFDDFLNVLSISGTVVGHIAVQATSTPDTEAINGLNAHNGEAAGDRFSRLCTEQGLAFRGQGQLSTSTAMGPQSQDTLMTLLQACVDADQGVLIEPRQVFGLGYRTRSSLYDQDAAITLSYPGKELASGLNPADDDQYTKNDVTVSRQNGSSARQALDSGPLSTQDPPGGVGTYDVEVTLNLQDDGQCNDAAGWLLNLGTVDEQRYPDIGVDLASSALSGIFYDLQRDDLGDRFVITGPPSWMPPDDISQITAQMTERIGGFVYQQDRTGVPATPYQVFEVEDTALGRIGTDGSTLTSAATSGATSLSVASTGALWTTTDVPFDIVIGGERITVTAVSGASSPQTFTVTRSGNGIVKAHSSGDAVALFTKPVIAW